jgi:Coenzyme PQQ synthesis protein D (PqqD)
MHTQSPTDSRLAALRALVPANVVYRTFPHETVMLNLDTGLYHGLNPVAGGMLASLERSPNALHAAREIAEEYSEALDRVATDLLELCEGLAERGLIRLEAIPAH